MPAPAEVKPRPRVLLVTRNLPPVIGGMERLIGHVAGTLCRNFATTIVGPRGGRIDGEARAYLACPVSPPAAFLAIAAARSHTAARHDRPALVIAGSGLTAPLARLAAHRAGVPYAVYLHGLDIAAEHAIYRRLFVPAIRNADLVLANSHHTAALAGAAGVPGSRTELLLPGVALPALPADRNRAGIRFRARFGLPRGPLLLGVGRLTPRKGFADFVTHALPSILRELPDAQFVVAGEVPLHATRRDGDEAARIRKAATDAGVGAHVHFVGPLDDAGLSLAWPAADVHVFPVRHDPADPEGFGMVALEAAAWGVPTVAFDTGGLPDAVGNGVSGYLVPAGDHDSFARRTLQAIGRQRELAPTARRFAERFRWAAFDERLTRLAFSLVAPAGRNAAAGS